MKLQEVVFKKPIRVIQVFRNINIYGKKDKSFDLRKEELLWKSIQSKSGFVSEDELYLPEQILTNPDFNKSDLITMEDDNNYQPFTSQHLQDTKIISFGNKPFLNHCFSLTRPNQIDIFELRFKEELELHLKYGYFEVGTPKRENFKLCDIKKNQAVEVKINGKTDFSLTSRRDRVFKEQHYIYNYIGDFLKCKILKEPYNSYTKYIPENRKVIDLIKQLW